MVNIKSFFPFIFLLSVFLAVTNTYALSVDDALNKAHAAEQEGEFKVALIHLKNSITENPKNTQLKMALAEVYLAIGDGVLAEIELNKMLSMGVEQSKIQVLLTKSALLQGEITKATRNINSILGLSTVDIARIRALQGRAYLQINNIEKADNLFLRSYKLAPNELEVQISMAIMYLSKGDYDNARKIIEPLHKQKPFNVDILMLAANIFMHDQQYDKAINTFNHIITIQPHNLTALLGKIKALMASENVIQASKNIQSLVEKYPDIEEIHNLRALIAYELKDYGKAHNSIVTIEKTNPNNKDILLLAGTVAFFLNHYDIAEKKLTAFLEYKPGNAAAIKRLANVYINQGKPEHALKLLSPFVKMDDTDVYILLGESYKLLGDSKQAGYYLGIAAERLPEEAKVQRWYTLSKLSAGTQLDLKFEDSDYEDFSGQGIVYILNEFNKGKIDNAILILQRYQEKSPNNAIITNLLGSAYLQKNDKAAAQKYFEKALKQNDQFILARINLAKLFIQKGDFLEAKRQYRSILTQEENNLAAILGMANISKKEQDEATMLHWLNKAMLQNPYAIKPRLILNQYYYTRRAFDKALVVSEELVALHPEDVTILNLHAQNLWVMNDFIWAINFYKKVTELQPESPQAWHRLAYAQYKNKQFSRAKASFQKSISLEPDNSGAKLLLVKIAIQEQQIETALRLANALLTEYPEKSIGYESLGDVYFIKENFKEAGEYYQTALSKQSDSRLLAKLFWIYVKSEQVSKALLIVENWLQEHPNDLKMRMMLALYYEKGLKLENAKKHYEIMIKQQPNYLAAINNLAMVYEQLDDIRGVEFAEIAYSLAPDSPEVNDTLGWLLLYNGEPKRALKLLKFANDMSPADLNIQYHYAEALLKNGENKSALKQLYMILPLNKPFKEREQAEKLFEQLKLQKKNIK